MDVGSQSKVSPESPIDLQVQRRIVDIGRLVSLPSTTFKLLNLLMEENTSARDLEKLLTQDPSLAAKVISLSNSALYSVREPVSTVARAITIIGFEELQNLALGLGLSDTFDLSSSPHGFDVKALWTHSMAVSWIARVLAEQTSAADPSEAMVGGLLHELGIIILVSKFPVHFQQLNDLVNSGLSLKEAENILGLRHEVIGYHLARNWNLPQVFQDVILYHHDYEISGQNVKIATLVSLADNLAHKSGFILKLEHMEINLSNILKILNVDTEKLQNIVKFILINIHKAEQSWLSFLETSKIKPKKASLSSLITQ
ncbi:MAG: HDOD domain-containing protein [Deltaproteobacteria bacterium]|jgi:HD-like signal output (HDOD) protein|nr:HDOD domain-containing protein [Deltaproteobacteria bacterium]